MILKRLKALWEQFLLDQAPVPLPDFPEDTLCRWQITFSGRVQGVGFRYETMELAMRLGLTGWCENLPDGTGLTQLQGPENRIRYLISALEAIPRIDITEKTIRQLPPVPGESGFDYR